MCVERLGISVRFALPVSGTTSRKQVTQHGGTANSSLYTALNKVTDPAIMRLDVAASRQSAISTYILLTFKQNK